jgi:GNAT superfamily N-acetyltransferase
LECCGSKPHSAAHSLPPGPALAHPLLYHFHPPSTPTPTPTPPFRLVCTATLLVERKFLHRGGRAGHIEDVVVDGACRGQSLGKRIIQHLLEVGRERGCYKVRG